MKDEKRTGCRGMERERTSMLVDRMIKKELDISLRRVVNDGKRATHSRYWLVIDE